MTDPNPTPTGQDEARRALADRLLTISDGDLREYARESLLGIHPDQTELRRWADLMDEAAELLLAPSLDRGAEEMRERAAKLVAYRAERARMAMQGGFDGWSANDTVNRTCVSLAAAIRALPVPADLNEGGGK